MFILFIAILLGLITHVSSYGHPLDSVPPLTWHQIPNTAIRQVLYLYPAGFNAGQSPHLRVFDESGATYDSMRNRMVLFGGGHADWSGNELYAFDIATLAWSRLNDPTICTDIPGTTEASGYYPVCINGQPTQPPAPDLQQPRSRHAYWYQVYLPPPMDRYCSMGLSYTYPNSKALPNVDCFDFTTNRWERKRDAMTWNGLITSLYDPQTGHVFSHGLQWDNTQGFWAEWNPITDTWIRRSPSPSGAKAGAAPLIDVARRRIVLLGGGQLRVVSLTPTGSQGYLPSFVMTPTGDTGVLRMYRGGFAHDTLHDKYVAWSGDVAHDLLPTDLYVIDPVSWVITKLTPAGVAPSMPTTFGGTTQSNGTYGRWAFIPPLGGFVLINNKLDEDVRFIRIGTGGLPVPPPASTVTLTLQ